MNRFENGFDSFKKAVTELKNRNENDFELKAIILDFHHAIEVLFKHILYSKEKYLIYKNMNEWINTAFDRKLGKINNQNKNTEYTISFDEAVRRVMVICEEQIDQYAYNGFLNLGRLRNALTHDEVELDKHTVEHIIVNLSPIVTSIMQKHLAEEEKRQFVDFTESEMYRKIMRQMIGNNLEWRIVTISSALKLYADKQYDSLSGTEIRHLELILSTLNVTVYDENILFNIDNEYYVTYVSYLKQSICNILIGYFDEIEHDHNLKEIIKGSKIMEEIIREYLINAALYVYGLINNGRDLSFQNIETIHAILDQNSFINNNDIFTVLGYIGEITKVLVMITGTKKREELLKNISLGGDDNDTVQLVFSTLLDWFVKNNWFNRINFKQMDEDILDAVEADRVYEQVERMIWEDDLSEGIIGRFGEWGIIDRIEDASVHTLMTIVRSDQEYILVYDAILLTQTYSDHEYYDNGSTECFIKVTGWIEKGRFEIREAEYIGAAVGYRNFRFD